MNTLSPAVRRRRTFSAIFLIAVLFLLYRGIRALYESPAFALETVEVSGNSGRRVSNQEIVDAAAVPTGTRLLKVSAAEVASRVRAVPWIAEARVERLVPSKLRITVVERRPQFLLSTAQGPFLVDAEGLVLQKGSEELVQLLDLPLGPLNDGERISTREFVNAAQIYSSLPRSLRTSIASISAPTVDQTTVNTIGGPSIFFGAAEKLDEKNFALESLLKRAQPGSVIDVRVPERPSIRAN